MLMIYRNKKTGAEIVTESVIISPKYELVDAKKEAPTVEPLVLEKTKAPKKRGTKK